MGDELLPLAAAWNEQFITGVAFVGPLTFEFVFVSHLHLSLFHLCIYNVCHTGYLKKRESVLSLKRKSSLNSPTFESFGHEDRLRLCHKNEIWKVVP